MSTLLLLMLSAALPPELLGPPLLQDGYQVRPPRAFRMARMELFHGTRAGSVSMTPRAPRFLSAALLDGEGEDAASMLISEVEASFSLSPASRDELSTAVLRHFRDDLALPFVLERAEVLGQLTSRVQVFGSVREGSQLRRILVAAFPGQGRHVVVLFSVPSGRWDELKPVIDQSLETLHLDVPGSALPRQWRWAFLALMASLLTLSVALWKRRQSRLENP